MMQCCYMSSHSQHVYKIKRITNEMYIYIYTDKATVPRPVNTDKATSE